MSSTEQSRTETSRSLYWRWLRELGGAFSAPRPNGRSWKTLLLKSEQGLEVYVRDRKSARHVGTLRPDSGIEAGAQISRLFLRKIAQGGSIVLRLPTSDVVDRVLQIPKAASDVLEPVLNNQMARVVPWPPQSTRYGYRIIGDNPGAPEQLDVQLVATTAVVIENALQQAKQHGLSPSAIDYGLEPQAQSGIELLSLTPDPVERAAKRWHIGLMFLLIASAGCGAAGAYAMWQKEQEYSALSHSIAVAKARVAQVRDLHEENLRLREQHERLIKRKSHEQATVMLVEALSRTLPDGAYLTSLELHDREVRLAGKSDDPASLIATLEASPEFEDVHFSAPTIQEEGAALTLFSIVARTELDPKIAGERP